jgi:hypothetical protein
MWLVHSTLPTNLKKILDDGEIKPSSQTGRERYDVATDKVYMSVVFEEKIFKYLHGPLIFFPIEIMEYYDVSHWSSNWNYGDMFDSDDEEEVSVKYNPKISPLKNAEIWKDIFYKIHPEAPYRWFTDGGRALMNEVVFNTSIPMGESSFIYLYENHNVNFEIPDRISTVKEVNKLLKNN